MKDVIGDLGIDIDPNDLDGIMDEAKKDADKQEKDKDGDREKKWVNFDFDWNKKRNTWWIKK